MALRWLTRHFSYDDPNSAVNRFRGNRHREFVAAIEAIPGNEPVRILDLGGGLRYWEKQGLPDRAIDLTLLNLGEPTSDDHDRAAALGHSVQVAQGDATSVDHPDMSFDVVFSNSVIEHVGSREAQFDFANETRRLAPRHYVQTPSFWFPLESHTRIPLFSFFPKPLKALVIWKGKPRYYPPSESFGAAMKAVDFTLLLRYDHMQAYFPGSEIRRERVGFMTKSYTACAGFS